MDPNIKSSSEEENDSSLAFLDTLTIKCPDGQIKTQVYRKYTQGTDQYLNYRSNHQADSVITEPEDQTREKCHIKEALKYCDYPSRAIERASKSGGQRPQNDRKHKDNKLV